MRMPSGQGEQVKWWWVRKGANIVGPRPPGRFGPPQFWLHGYGLGSQPDAFTLMTLAKATPTPVLTSKKEKKKHEKKEGEKTHKTFWKTLHLSLPCLTLSNTDWIWQNHAWPCLPSLFTLLCGFVWQFMDCSCCCILFNKAVTYHISALSVQS